MFRGGRARPQSPAPLPAPGRASVTLSAGRLASGQACWRCSRRRHQLRGPGRDPRQVPDYSFTLRRVDLPGRLEFKSQHSLSWWGDMNIIRLSRPQLARPQNGNLPEMQGRQSTSSLDTLVIPSVLNTVLLKPPSAESLLGISDGDTGEAQAPRSSPLAPCPGDARTVGSH